MTTKYTTEYVTHIAERILETCVYETAAPDKGDRWIMMDMNDVIYILAVLQDALVTVPKEDIKIQEHLFEAIDRIIETYDANIDTNNLGAPQIVKH